MVQELIVYITNKNAPMVLMKWRGIVNFIIFIKS